jgi:hypothetical protein
VSYGERLLTFATVCILVAQAILGAAWGGGWSYLVINLSFALALLAAWAAGGVDRDGT